MKKELFTIVLAFSLLLVATSAKSVMAQNITTNASNTAGNMSSSLNNTGAAIGKNVSNTMGNASQSANATMSELGKNASIAMNKTGESINATANELGSNASNMDSTLLNKTGEVAKKIVGGAATVLGNISGEIKKGLGEK